MTRSELIEKMLQNHSGMKAADAEKIVLVIFDEITKALARGQRVELRGFGVFSVRERGAHAGRNPRTGEFVHVYKKKTPFFKAGKLLKDRLNS